VRRVIVNIDSLILKGFRHEDRHVIAAVVQEEIARVLAVPNAAPRLAQLGSTPQLRIGNVNLAPHANPQQTGTATGRAIGEGMIK
jgi:hypothetical protein